MYSSCIYLHIYIFVHIHTYIYMHIYIMIKFGCGQLKANSQRSRRQIHTLSNVQQCIEPVLPVLHYVGITCLHQKDNRMLNAIYSTSFSSLSLLLARSPFKAIIMVFSLLSYAKYAQNLYKNNFLPYKTEHMLRRHTYVGSLTLYMGYS